MSTTHLNELTINLTGINYQSTPMAPLQSDDDVNVFTSGTNNNDEDKQRTVPVPPPTTTTTTTTTVAKNPNNNKRALPLAFSIAKIMEISPNSTNKRKRPYEYTGSDQCKSSDTFPEDVNFKEKENKKFGQSEFSLKSETQTHNKKENRIHEAHSAHVTNGCDQSDAVQTQFITAGGQFHESAFRKYSSVQPHVQSKSQVFNRLTRSANSIDEQLVGHGGSPDLSPTSAASIENPQTISPYLRSYPFLYYPLARETGCGPIVLNPYIANFNPSTSTSTSNGGHDVSASSHLPRTMFRPPIHHQNGLFPTQPYPGIYSKEQNFPITAFTATATFGVGLTLACRSHLTNDGSLVEPIFLTTNPTGHHVSNGTQSTTASPANDSTSNRLFTLENRRISPKSRFGSTEMAEHLTQNSNKFYDRPRTFSGTGRSTPEQHNDDYYNHLRESESVLSDSSTSSSLSRASSPNCPSLSSNTSHYSWPSTRNSEGTTVTAANKVNSTKKPNVNGEINSHMTSSGGVHATPMALASSAVVAARLLLMWRMCGFDRSICAVESNFRGVHAQSNKL
ncbi:hypothetical protein CHUAL_006800 [Chamberlinius hualienensis]